MSSCGSSLFGPPSQYIKVVGGDFVAIQGANIMEKLTVSDLRMPYKQILKSRIILKPGQTNYLLNHLGLGDNATFLAIKAIYDPKSVIEEDNFINWSFTQSSLEIYTMAQMMVLTGNSTNRIKQLYLTNPNTKYEVTLEVMIGTIDDEYSFFSENSQVGTLFTGLEYDDIKSYIVNQSIVINDKSTPAKPLIYIYIRHIDTISINQDLIIVNVLNYGKIFLHFLTEYDAIQAQSLLNYIKNNPDVDIDNLSPLYDDIEPTIYFYSHVGNTSSNSFIAFNGATNSTPYNTSQGFTFSTEFNNLMTASPSIPVTKEYIIESIIDYALDNRDGTMSMTSSNINIFDGTYSISEITSAGTYSVKFNLGDMAQNYINSNITMQIIIN